MTTVASMFVVGMSTIFQIIDNLGLSFVDWFIYTFTHQVPYQHVWSSLHTENYLSLIALISVITFLLVGASLVSNKLEK